MSTPSEVAEKYTPTGEIDVPNLEEKFHGQTSERRKLLARKHNANGLTTQV